MKTHTPTGCSPAKPSTAGTRRVTIEVNADLFEEVRNLLESTDGVAVLRAGNTMKKRLTACAETWMKNMTFALGGSGYQQAIAAAGKGGRP